MDQTWSVTYIDFELLIGCRCREADGVHAKASCCLGSRSIGADTEVDDGGGAAMGVARGEDASGKGRGQAVCRYRGMVQRHYRG